MLLNIVRLRVSKRKRYTAQVSNRQSEEKKAKRETDERRGEEGRRGEGSNNYNSKTAQRLFSQEYVPVPYTTKAELSPCVCVCEWYTV